MVAELIASWLSSRLGGPSWWAGRQPFQSAFPLRLFTGPQILSHLALAHGLASRTTRWLDGSYWSLSTESQFYVVFPLLVILAWRWSAAKVAAAGIAISVAAALSVQSINGLHRVLIPDMLPFYLCGFCLGMWCAEIVVGGASRRALLAVSCIGFLAAAVAIPLEHFSPSSVVLSSVWAAGFAALLVVGARGTMQFYRGALFGPLVSPRSSTGAFS
jgi:peptidoglycan/LPS O-acetylase OafA/YrhL